MKKWGLFSLIFALLVLLAACGDESGNSEADTNSNSDDDTYVIKAGHAASEDHFAQGSFEKFKELVEEKSDGKIKVEIYPNGQLGGEREMVEAIQLGNLTMAAPSSAVLTSFASGMYLWDLPFLFEDAAMAHEVLDGEVGTEVLDSLSDVGIKGLGYWENGFRHLMNNTHEVSTIEGMKGLKIRTLESQQQIQMWNATGANATPIAFTELYSALQQGTVDAAESPLALMYAQKFQEVQKYLTLTGHLYSPWPVVISQKFFDDLPADLQQVVQDAVDETRTFNRQLSAEDEAKSLELLQEGGMEYVELTSEEKEKFKKAMEVVYPEIEKLVGEDLYKKLMDAVE
ncbi:tripartite ATP-independent transporter solute receptor, DctP family [Psychrobacillus psychrotolerans]|uniref:Tripartite ATP-independent transporter solute receptor, DctP family n=1 Tax=Psychrobacillus psychrotolerans TaxID=126156 RepID=A0A1I6ABY2_9BACI|nr:DctP family TRAP transporter solute-binding subunit [Psychrobacillus psychrotolerans]SFQ66067.1 tripartite ATP-independent transporter solute receptor, DctP family [Psychrobacillus psychrotolerans]